MNTLRGFLFVCCATAFMVSGCQQQQKQANSNQSEVDSDVRPPSGIISKKQAQMLYDNYSRFRVPEIDSFEQGRRPNEEFKATRFLSIEFQRLKDYIAYVENEAKLAQVPVENFRIYLATNPADSKAKFPRRNTVFILPTTKKNGLEFGFFTVTEGENSRRALPISAKLSKELGFSTTTVEKNEASLLPFFNSSLNSNLFIL